MTEIKYILSAFSLVVVVWIIYIARLDDTTGDMKTLDNITKAGSAFDESNEHKPDVSEQHQAVNPNETTRHTTLNPPTTHQKGDIASGVPRV